MESFQSSAGWKALLPALGAATALGAGAGIVLLVVIKVARSVARAAFPSKSAANEHVSQEKKAPSGSKKKASNKPIPTETSSVVHREEQEDKEETVAITPVAASGKLKKRRKKKAKEVDDDEEDQDGAESPTVASASGPAIATQVPVTSAAASVEVLLEEPDLQCWTEVPKKKGKEEEDEQATKRSDKVADLRRRKAAIAKKIKSLEEGLGSTGGSGSRDEGERRALEARSRLLDDLNNVNASIQRLTAIADPGLEEEGKEVEDEEEEDWPEDAQDWEWAAEEWGAATGSRRRRARGTWDVWDSGGDWWSAWDTGGWEDSFTAWQDASAEAEWWPSSSRSSWAVAGDQAWRRGRRSGGKRRGKGASGTWVEGEEEDAQEDDVGEAEEEAVVEEPSSSSRRGKGSRRERERARRESGKGRANNRDTQDAEEGDEEEAEQVDAKGKYWRRKDDQSGADERSGADAAAIEEEDGKAKGGKAKKGKGKDGKFKDGKSKDGKGKGERRSKGKGKDGKDDPASVEDWLQRRLGRSPANATQQADDNADGGANPNSTNEGGQENAQSSTAATRGKVYSTIGGRLGAERTNWGDEESSDDDARLLGPLRNVTVPRKIPSAH